MPTQGPGSSTASVGLAVAGNEQLQAGWQPQPQTGQVSGCGVEPVLTWELKPLPDPTGGTGE